LEYLQKNDLEALEVPSEDTLTVADTSVQPPKKDVATSEEGRIVAEEPLQAPEVDEIPMDEMKAAKPEDSKKRHTP
jgi:hypothetical protein